MITEDRRIPRPTIERYLRIQTWVSWYHERLGEIRRDITLSDPKHTDTPYTIHYAIDFHDIHDWLLPYHRLYTAPPPTEEAATSLRRELTRNHAARSRLFYGGVPESCKIMLPPYQTELREFQQLMHYYAVYAANQEGLTPILADVVKELNESRHTDTITFVAQNYSELLFVLTGYYHDGLRELQSLRTSGRLVGEIRDIGDQLGADAQPKVDGLSILPEAREHFESNRPLKALANRRDIDALEILQDWNKRLIRHRHLVLLVSSAPKTQEFMTTSKGIAETSILLHDGRKLPMWRSLGYFSVLASLQPTAHSTEQHLDLGIVDEELQIAKEFLRYESDFAPSLPEAQVPPAVIGGLTRSINRLTRAKYEIDNLRLFKSFGSLETGQAVAPWAARKTTQQLSELYEDIVNLGQQSDWIELVESRIRELVDVVEDGLVGVYAQQIAFTKPYSEEYLRNFRGFPYWVEFNHAGLAMAAMRLQDAVIPREGHQPSVETVREELRALTEASTAQDARAERRLVWAVLCSAYGQWSRVIKIADLEIGSEHSTTDQQLRYIAARAHCRTDGKSHKRTAVRILQDALREYPKSVRLHHLLAFCIGEWCGENATPLYNYTLIDAIQLAEKALELGPRTPALTAVIHNNLAYWWTQLATEEALNSAYEHSEQIKTIIDEVGYAMPPWLDTIGYVFVELAKVEPDKSQKRLLLVQATDYVRRALALPLLRRDEVEVFSKHLREAEDLMAGIMVL